MEIKKREKLLRLRKLQTKGLTLEKVTEKVVKLKKKSVENLVELRN